MDNVHCFKVNLPVDEAVLKCKESFYQKLIEYDEKLGGPKKPWTEAKIKEVINFLKSGTEAGNRGKQKTSSEYYWASKYDIMKTIDEEYLVFKPKQPDDPSVLILPREQYFDILYKVHESCGHGGRDKMVFNLKPKIYIPVKAIEIFLTVCPKCSTKKQKGVLLTRPNLGGVFKIIDLQSCPDDDYKWVLHYQDDATKYSCVRPMKSKRSKEVATELLKIFLTFGAPDSLLSSVNGEFTVKVIDTIKEMWPICNMKPAKANKSINDQVIDIEDMLQTWMKENSSSNWTLGCYFVQNLINLKMNYTIGKTPFKAFLGRDSKVDLNVSCPTTTAAENSQIYLEEIKLETPDSDVEEEVLDDNESIQNLQENTGLDKANLEKFQNLQNLTCIVCQTEASAKTGAHKCMSCKSVHVICGLSDGNEITDSKIVCFICNRNIQAERNEERKGIKRGAENNDRNLKKNPKTTNQGDLQWDPLNIPVSFEPTASQSKCTCKPHQSQCITQKCTCFKNNISCGAACHTSSNCANTSVSSKLTQN